ncbi:MAG: hypothetical protein HEQ13_07850 [Dolichospermum sp. DEX189]|uniref:hypothetical protein n=1 Tax=Aphanizomenon flos-aquae TaxID=1176 RepID=UPI00190F7733|nr:hypothetical protein [Aphanizomenon flos-aquae]MBO1069280.1 hypothetical protein [Dolichospermum sp. DEX189]QSV69353.1 MAG: hypothetical protein HEQ20_05960 [Aphanizomenon flos-aquae KM1D3_PB]
MSLWEGKRQEARGKSEEALGDFTFLYTLWFYCVHLLNIILVNSIGLIMMTRIVNKLLKSPHLFS